MLSNAAKTSLFNMIFGKAQNNSLLSTCYLGLLTIVPATSDTADTYQEPPTANGYKRTLLGNYQTAVTQLMETAYVSGELVARNKDIIYFPECTGTDWPPILGWGLFSSESGGSPLFYGTLSQSQTIQVGYVPMFKAEQFIMKIDPVMS